MGERRNDGRRWFEPPKDMPGNQIHSTAKKEVQRLQHSLDRDVVHRPSDKDRIELRYSKCDLSRKTTRRSGGRSQMKRPHPAVKEFEDIRDYFKSKS
jgi:hypothetical protein